jgi:hypothetical protein
MKSAFALTCSSFTSEPKQFQLFHPIGGFGARDEKSMETVPDFRHPHPTAKASRVPAAMIPTRLMCMTIFLSRMIRF